MDQKLKRSLDIDNDIPLKKIKIEYKNILLFSDCVLSIILSYLNAYDLYCLSKTCQRFKYLITEKKLWKKIDIVDHPMCAHKFNFFFSNINNCTDTVLIRGINRKEKTLTFYQFIKMCIINDNLTVLAIENQYINSDEICIKDFPKNLKELSLRSTHIFGRQPFLHSANLRLTKLHTLVLDDCKWFHEHSLMALSKLPNLENLSLYNCANLNDSVAYMSITAKFGFRKLLRIDARRTSIGDQFLKCFHCIKTLREIYLEAPKRREIKSEPLFDKLKRLCGPEVEENSNAVVFNCSNIFKLRKDRLKSKKKFQKPLNTPLTIPSESRTDCLENCFDCSVENCSLMARFSKFNDSDSCSQSLSQTDASKLISLNQNENTIESPVKLSISISLKNESSQQCSQINSQSTSSQTPNTPTQCESPPHIPPEESPGSPFEKYFCDEIISDSEDEIDDFEIFHSDVTDSGLQWFCTSDPDGSDALGHDSVLFRKPYGACSCEIKQNTTAKEDFDKPGPSGVGSFSDAGVPPRRHYHNDVTVNVSGQGALSLKIAYESNAAPRPQEEASPPPRGRDLRVIIERLDPGIHIVYDQGARVHFDNFARDYTTKLKVFVARGYKLVTNHALRSLQDLNLEILDVTGTSVTAKGIRDFLTLNPDCRVIHENFCNCANNT